MSNKSRAINETTKKFDLFVVVNKKYPNLPLIDCFYLYLFKIIENYSFDYHTMFGMQIH